MIRSLLAIALAASLGAAGCARGGSGGGGPREGGVIDARTSEGGARDAASEAGGDAAEGDDAATDASPMDAGVDTGPGFDAGPLPTGMCDPTAATLHVVEVMISSRSGSGDRGEWFEVRNTGTCEIRLAGVALVSPTGSGTDAVHAVMSGSLPAGESFVFALSMSPTDNHGLPFDYAYGTGAADDLILNNSTDWLELRLGATVLDHVEWPSGGFTHGRSQQFPPGIPVGGNSEWTNWCATPTTSVYPPDGGSFYGTPQLPNVPCP